jgi:hypothetical protein
VSDYMDLSSCHTLWNPSFIRATHDWEIESLDSFLTLYSMNPHSREVDSMVWTPSCHGFVVKSYYTMLQSGEHISFPWKSIWKVKALSRIAFFLWATTLDGILPVDNLIRRGFQLVNRCCPIRKMGKLLIIFFSIVSILLTFGT